MDLLRPSGLHNGRWSFVAGHPIESFQIEGECTWRSGSDAESLRTPRALSLVQLSAPILVAYTPIINEEADFYPLHALVHAGTMYKLRMFRAQQNHPIGSNGICSDKRADAQAQNFLNSIRLSNEDKRLSPHILTGGVTLINEQQNLNY